MEINFIPYLAQETILGFFIPTMALIEDLELSQCITQHPIFIKWSDLARKIDAIHNDVCRLEKDLKYGEEDGMIFKKVRKNFSLRNALQDELNFLG